MTETTYTEAQYSSEAGMNLILTWLAGRCQRDVDHCARYMSRQLRIGTLPECRSLVRGAITWDERPRWALLAVDLPTAPDGKTRGYFEVVSLDMLPPGSVVSFRRRRREECVDAATSLATIHWDEVVSKEPSHE